MVHFNLNIEAQDTIHAVTLIDSFTETEIEKQKSG